jgi:Icc-related predicted phosphoesterase
MSDLHLEAQGMEHPQSGNGDVVILAGDIHNGLFGIHWALEQFTVPVIYVPGNHEFYGYSRPDLIVKMRRLCRGTHVHLLEQDSLDIGSYRFHGTTLWTDFAVAGDRRGAMRIAQRFMPDYRAIQASQGESFTPQRALELHHRSLAWLQGQVVKSQGFTNIVISHHAPSPRSIAARYQGNILNPAFITDLEGMIAGNNIALWVHGHTHTAFDYNIGGTRVVCNPRGYLPYETDTGFDSGKIIALAETDHEPAPGAS